MKGHDVEDWIAVRRLPPGRRQWAFANTLARLPASSAALRALAEEGQAADGRLVALLLRFKGGQLGTDARVWPPEVVALDAAVDRKMGDLNVLFRTFASLFAGKPVGARWQALVDATFAGGATYYTAKPYIEEAAAIAALKAELGDAKWSELTGESLVKEALAELDLVYQPYADKVGRFTDSSRVSWDEVKALDLANHRRLCVFVAGIVHELASDEAARKAALAPIAQQDQEVYELLRDRRKVTDIDPSTGDPVEPPPAPSPTPA